MSSRKELRLTGISRRAFTLAALLALGGCFQPMYGDRSIGGTGTNLRNALRDVEIAPIEGRVGQELRNDLIFELGGGSGNPVGAPYRLHLTVATNSFSAILDPVSGLGQAVKFGYDGLDMVAEGDSAGAIQRRYVFADGPSTGSGQGVDEPALDDHATARASWAASNRAWAAWIVSTWSVAQVASWQIGRCNDCPSSVSS